MNVLEILDRELEEKKHLSLDDKKRFLYLRMCQIFIYDTRLHYVKLLGEAGKELKNEILERKIDLENVDDFRVCCASFSPAYQEALKKLLNVDSMLVGNGHRWVELESDNHIIKADGTLGDLSRAKFEMRTRGYGPSKKNAEFQEILENRDIRINYIQHFYEDIANLLLNGSKAIDYRSDYELFGKYDISDSDKREQHIFDKISNDLFESLFWEMLNFDTLSSQSLMNKEVLSFARKHFADCIFAEYERIRNNEVLVNLCALKRVQCSFNEISATIQNYEDAKFILNYMFQCFMFVDDANSFSQIALFQNSDDNWDFVTIYVFNFNNSPIYFALRKENEAWHFKEISLEEAALLERNYKGQNKEVLHRQK